MLKYKNGRNWHLRLYRRFHFIQIQSNYLIFQIFSNLDHFFLIADLVQSTICATWIFGKMNWHFPDRKGLCCEHA